MECKNKLDALSVICDFFGDLDCVYVCVSMCNHAHAGTYRGQKRPLDLLDLEVRAVVSRPMWVLGIESSARAASTLNS